MAEIRLTTDIFFLNSAEVFHIQCNKLEKNWHQLSVTSLHSYLKRHARNTLCWNVRALVVRHQPSSWKHRFNLHRGLELHIIGRF